MYRRVILVTTAILVSLSMFVDIFPQSVSAAGTLPVPYLSATATQAATFNTERNSLALCVAGSVNGTTSAQDIANLKWFNPSTQVRQWFDYTDASGGVGCDSLSLSTYLINLGWNSNLQAACDLGLVRSAASEKNNCVNGNSSFNRPGTLDKQAVLNNIDKVYKGVPPFGKDYTPEQFYVMAMKLLTSSKACQANATGIVSGASADLKTKANAAITVVSADGSSVPTYYTFGGDQGISWGFRNFSGNDSRWYSDSCKQLATIANDNSGAYARWVQQNPAASASNAGTCDQYATLYMGGPVQAAQNKTLYNTILQACTDGMQNKATANYCTSQHPVSKGKPANDACLYGVKNATTNNGTTDNPTSSDAKPTCGIDGIGWLVCPVMNFMAKVNDAAYGFLSSYFLSIDTGLVNGSQTAWSKFRDIANVAFVIAILFIVYSQISSVGLNNYGIKKMLPRLIVAALLVNMSFYICAAAVDLSNVLGYAIPQFLENTVQLGTGVKDTGGTGGVIIATIGWATVIGTVVAGAVGVALAISVPVLLAAILAIGLVVLMLIGRQAFIVLLIVVSPLAFVAYLLPNTEQWFKKWYKAFFSLLMLFPIIGAVFGASRLAANIIYNTTGTGNDSTIMSIIALAVTAVPFFVVPGLLKGSLAAAGTLGTKLGGMTGKATGKIGSRVKDTTKIGTGLADMKKFKDQKRAINLAKNRGSGLVGAVGRLKGGKGYHENAVLKSSSLEAEEYENKVKDAERNMTLDPDMSYTRRQNIAQGKEKSSDVERDAAVRFIMNNGSFDERKDTLETIGNMTAGQRRSAINGARTKGDTGVFGSKTLGELEEGVFAGGKTDVASIKAQLAAGTKKRIEDGNLAPETFVRDDYTAKYVAGQAKDVSADKQKQLADSLTNYVQSDQGSKTVDSVRDQVVVVAGNSATANAASPATGTLSVQHPNNTSVPSSQPPAPTPAPPTSPTAPPPTTP